MIARRAIWVLLPLLLASTAMRAGELAPEPVVKAGFILNIARYAEWPLSGLEGRNIPLCLLGETGLASATSSLEGRFVRGRTIVVSTISALDEVGDCAILFVAPEWEEQLDSVCAIAQETSALTIADTPGFAERCVMINLVRAGTRITFEVNQRAANQARIRLSSELLKLGRLVETNDG